MVDSNLLSITSIPIKVEINIRKGELSNPKINDPGKALKMNIQTDQGELKIHSEPPKIKIDTYAARSSLGFGHYNNADFVKRNANDGISVAYQGTAKIVNEGDQLVRGVSPAEIAAQNNKAGQTIQTIMDFLPKEGADVTFDDGVLNINYDAGDVNIDWDNAGIVPLEFIPGKVEFNITQLPKVEIEYLGDPIYVPPQSDPNYVPKIDVHG
ncbi:MAG: hypothetical protein IJU82_04970 [Ruminiclostridium sp.]|nr:hypothetical protein [Ruminiclostridium sp.]